MRRLLLAALAALCLVTPASANDTRINSVASVFAMKPVTVDCRTEQQDAILGWAWGYTQVGDNQAVIDQSLCDQLVALLDHQPVDDWLAAVAIATVVHESGHMRGAWWSGSEARTECFAVRHWKYGAAFFGVDQETTARLWPWALYDHWSLVALVPQYFLKGCIVPKP